MINGTFLKSIPKFFSNKAPSYATAELVNTISMALKSSLKEFKESDFVEPKIPQNDYKQILDLNKSIG